MQLGLTQHAFKSNRCQQTSAAIVDFGSRSNMMATYSSSSIQRQEQHSAAGATFSSRSNVHSSKSNVHSSKSNVHSSKSNVHSSKSNIHSSRWQHSQQQGATFTAAGGNIHNSRSNIHSSRGQHSQQQEQHSQQQGQHSSTEAALLSSRGNTHPQKQHCSAKAATEFHSSTMTSNTQQHVCSAC